MKNVTITDNSAQLQLPANIQTIQADTKVASSISVSEQLTKVDMVGLNQEIAANRSETIAFAGKDNVITVKSGVSVGAINLSGENVQIVNNGTVELAYIARDAKVVKIENNGNLNCFQMIGTNAKVELVNKGIIARTDDKHTINIQSAGEFKLENRGTISGMGKNPYALLFYGTCKVDVYAYSGSVVTGGFAPYSGDHTITIRYASGSTIDGKDWSRVASQKYGVVVYKLAD